MGIELFVTIHMSIFVLFPIAAMLKPDNIRETFMNMFLLRLIILFTIDLFFPDIFIVDFLAVFFGAFIVVPLMAAIKGKKYFSVKIVDSTKTDRFINKNYKWKEVETEKEEQNVIIPKTNNHHDDNNDVIRYK